MIRRALLAGLLIATFAVVSLAADLNGRWEGTFSTPNGDIQLTFNFKVDGAKLTGTVETPNGDTPISDGTVNGDNFSFKVQVGDSEITHEGTISGDTIQMKVEGPWGNSQVTLKRAAEKKSSAARSPFAARGLAA
ncbi:MAG: hypothetical protein ACRD19_13700 [Terriglobia bacterium]